MALESFGTETAEAVDEAVRIAHDAIMKGRPFALEDEGIWSVFSIAAHEDFYGVDDDKAAVVIVLYAG